VRHYAYIPGPLSKAAALAHRPPIAPDPMPRLDAAVRAARAFLPAVLVVIALPLHAFDIQGHRGARGLAPENTLAAFRAGLARGATTLETDLQVTRDGVLVISHNPRLSPDLTRDASGRFLAAEGPRIHDLTLAELAQYDIGRVNPDTAYGREWPGQMAADGERIPTLAQLFDLVKASAPKARLNIETKLSPDAPAEAPAPETFARLVVEAVHAAGMSERVTIQSFDWRTLVAVKRLDPSLRTSCLTIETAKTNNVAGRNGGASGWTAGFDLAAAGGSVPRLARMAGCDVWSPFWRNATPERIDEAHRLGLAVLPWTVDDTDAMRRLMDAGVDGIITDYPDRLRALVKVP
jgi:glycerophosphoryl diester phosphodiesterase